ELWQTYQDKLRVLDRKIEEHLRVMKKRQELPPLPPKPQRKRKPNEPHFDVRTALYYVTGVDLTAIEGIDGTTALVVVSEIGTDMSRWPTVKHFTSWLGLCPHQQVSGGKVLSRRTKACANRAATALRLAAQALHHSQRAVRAFFRRMKARLGAPSALSATAHKPARLIYTKPKH